MTCETLYLTHCSCGNQTKHTENFTHLSLDLVPRGSIEDMLDMHLMVRSFFSEIMSHSYTKLSSEESSYQPVVHVQETELNYKCDCGNHKSCQHSSFLSLPRSVTTHTEQRGTKTNILARF